jgi:diguanylate cyclase (GGDEF)-like protein
MSTRIVFKDGAPCGVQGIARDITERKQSESALRHIAFHDALTGLPNRALFTQQLRVAVEGARRESRTLFAVLFIDLDRFKVINDSLGHPLGDELLVALARRLEGTMRGGDTVARLGGDEFAILLNDLDRPEDALRAVPTRRARGLHHRLHRHRALDHRLHERGRGLARRRHRHVSREGWRVGTL